MKKIVLHLTLCAMLFALSSSAHAQQPGKIFRIGFLDPSTASGTAVLVDVFRQELSKHGWIEGKNITIDYRFAENKGQDRLTELAAELVRLKVDLIVTTGDGPTFGAKKATTTIPIVMTTSSDPVGAGADALIIPSSGFLALYRKRIVELAAQSGLPLIATEGTWADGLMVPTLFVQ